MLYDPQGVRYGVAFADEKSSRVEVTVALDGRQNRVYGTGEMQESL